VYLFEGGTDTAKTTIYGRLKLAEPGPGYLHFSMAYEREHFEQLTAEKQVTTFRKGFRLVEWVKEPNKRNEALDVTVTSLAALTILNPNLESLAESMAQHQPGLPPAAAPEPERPRGGWISGNRTPPRPNRRGGWGRRR
jgi:phage terminase large subunit GpA-like protein